MSMSLRTCKEYLSYSPEEGILTYIKSPATQIPIYNTTTYVELKTMALDWQTTDHIENIDGIAFEEAIEELFENVDLDEVIDPTLDDVEDDDSFEEYYMFFTIETIEEDGIDNVGIA